MIKIKVPDMHCEGCVKRITNALSAAQLDFSVSLENKTVTLQGAESDAKTAVNKLEDLGFTPKIMQ